MKNCIYFIILFILFSANQVYSQEIDTATYQVIMEGGNEFVGKKISENSDFITLNTEEYGEVKLFKKRIKIIKRLEVVKKVAGEVWLSNVQEARYFFGPNSYNLREGDVYYQNVWVFFNQISYGFTDHFSVGIGTLPIFLLGAGVVPLWITPKLSIPIVENKLNMGVGALTGGVLGESESGFGIIYGTITLGDRDNNLTLGVGTAYAAGEFAPDPVINIGGMLRTGKKGYLITENYIFPDLRLVSAGGRTVWPNLSLDYGLFTPLGVGETVFIPWLGIVIPLGKTRN